MKSETATPAVTPQPMSDERKGRRSLSVSGAARVISILDILGGEATEVLRGQRKHHTSEASERDRSGMRPRASSSTHREPSSIPSCRDVRTNVRSYAFPILLRVSFARGRRPWVCGLLACAVLTGWTLYLTWRGAISIVERCMQMSNATQQCSLVGTERRDGGRLIRRNRS